MVDESAAFGPPIFLGWGFFAVAGYENASAAFGFVSFFKVFATRAQRCIDPKISKDRTLFHCGIYRLLWKV